MTQQVKRILIGVKPWESSLPLSTARLIALARGFDAQVALTSCVGLSSAVKGIAWTDPTFGTDVEATLADRRQDDLAGLELLAQPVRDAGVRVATRVTPESRAQDGLLDEVATWQADLLVVGTDERHSAPGAGLTEVERKLIELCPCPLLLARSADAEPYGTILAAVDPLHGHAEPPGLDHAILGLGRAFRDALDAELCIVNVCPDAADFEIVSAIEVEPGVFYGAENIEAAYREAVTSLVDECKIAESEIVIRAGRPAEIIIEVAGEKSADLILIGSIKRRQLEAAVLGSTAEDVIGATSCDALLVKPPT